MIRNYLTVAFRNIIRHKAFAAINIAGLAIGMACSIFIFLWVQNELSYDRFHKNLPGLYRITANAGDFKVAVNPAVMPPGLQSVLPVIREYIRFSHPTKNVFETGTRKFEETNGYFADSNLLQVFSFPLVKGNAATALNRPDAIIISEDMAQKYFGAGDPMGKLLKMNNKNNLVVTGVLKNIPANSHLQFDHIMPLSAIAKTDYDIVNNKWDNYNYYSYLLLDPSLEATPANLASLEKQIDNVYTKHVPPEELKVAFHLQPLKDIHLHSNFQADIAGHGNYLYVKIFFVVAIFILAVACINFMNLATARSARRAKEVGLRKVVGAGRRQLIQQFLGESLLIALTSLVIAILLAWLFLPAFNYLAGKSLAIKLYDWRLLLSLTCIALVSGVMAGSYPALFLSGFQPVKVLKGNLRSLSGNLVFRNVLVVTQFVVSIVLLAGTAIVYKQLRYIKTMSLGFDKSNLIYVPMSGEIWDKRDAYKASLLQNPLTAQYAFTSDMPTNLSSGTVSVKWDGKDPNSQVVIPTLQVNENFINVFQMKILSGRSFSKEFKADTSNYMINETAAKLMGYTAETAIGKSLTLWDTKGTIIGVVKDFNFKPVQNAIEPLIMPLNNWGGITVIRSQAGKTEASIKALEKIHTALNPAYPFSYGFVDEDLDRMYRGEQQMGNLFNVFALLGIIISCLGLYGLSAFIAEQRTKEIGVRKVLGASVFNVVYMLSTNFTRLVLIAIVFAVPIAWFAINSWLQGFAYRVQVDWVIFLVAALVALLVALITVSYESIKAALVNPIKSLRTE